MTELLFFLKALFRSLPIEVREYVWIAQDSYSNLWLYALVVGVFLLERVIPAQKPQPVLSRGVLQDFLWFNADGLVKLMWLPLLLGGLQAFYNRHLGFLTIHWVEAWPMTVRVAVSLFIFDFLLWVHHVIRHRVQVFWYFHMIHHSQRQMNLFTDARAHVVEHLVAHVIIFIPMFMFQLNHFTVFWVSLFCQWYPRIYHANLRTDYGIFKHVLVTPQSHRIHHSLDPKHWNKNFGVIFTLWDRAFGTLYAKYDEYPQTGVEDERFPLEQAVGGLAVFGTFLAQNLYPFRRIWNDLMRPQPHEASV